MAPEPFPAERPADRRHRPAVPEAASEHAGRRRHGRERGRHAPKDRPARQHIRRLQLRQRLPPWPAPPPAGKDDRVRGGHPRAPYRARARRPRGQEGGRPLDEHRSRADVRRPGWSQDTELRERAVTGVRAARQEARPRAQGCARRALRREPPGAAAPKPPRPRSRIPTTTPIHRTRERRARARRRPRYAAASSSPSASPSTPRSAPTATPTSSTSRENVSSTTCRADPDQLHNIVSTADPKLVRDLAKQLSALQNCKGGGCRVADRG